MKVAIIGTRTPTDLQSSTAISVTKHYASWGAQIVTGAARGVDYLAMAHSNPDKGGLVVFLPWRLYNSNTIPPWGERVVYDSVRDIEWNKSVWTYHPNAGGLRHGAFALHARNFGIVSNADVVVAFPSPEGGGTEQGIRIAKGLKRKLFILRGGAWEAHFVTSEECDEFMSLIQGVSVVGGVKG